MDLATEMDKDSNIDMDVDMRTAMDSDTEYVLFHVSVHVRVRVHVSEFSMLIQLTTFNTYFCSGLILVVSVIISLDFANSFLI
jgi:hypothetical protein